MGLTCLGFHLIHVTEGDYFDLSAIPERYTGYSGPDAHRIWRSIYEENCFGLAEYNLMSGKAPGPVSIPETLHAPLSEETDTCLEKRVYYKVISGSCFSLRVVPY